MKNRKFRESMHGMSGFDHLAYYIGKENVSGYLIESPLAQRLEKDFGINSSEKSYQAHWMISSNKLYLGYVNGHVKSKQLFTTDFIPEFPDEEILYHYTPFSGTLTLHVQERKSGSAFKRKFGDSDLIDILIKDGNVII